MMYDDVHCRREIMLSTATTMALLYGCVGGALPDVLRLIEGRHGQVPAYLGSVYFWLSLVLLVALGGVAAIVLAGGGPVEPIKALAIGYTAPSVVSKLLSNGAGSPRGVDRALAGPRSLRAWWSN
jgi:hypothetical protein